VPSLSPEGFSTQGRLLGDGLAYWRVPVAHFALSLGIEAWLKRHEAQVDKAPQNAAVKVASLIGEALTDAAIGQVVGEGADLLATGFASPSFEPLHEEPRRLDCLSVGEDNLANVFFCEIKPVQGLQLVWAAHSLETPEWMKNGFQYPSDRHPWINAH